MTLPACPLLTRTEVEHLTLFSTSGLYAAMNRGEFPRPVRIGRRKVAWRRDDVEEWLANRPIAHPDAQHPHGQ